MIVFPISIKCSVSPEWLKSTALDSLFGVSSINDLSDSELRKFHQVDAKESKEELAIRALVNIVNKELRTNMADTNAKSRIKNLVHSFDSLLPSHGLSWILDDNQKVAIFHVFSEFRPRYLWTHLQSDRKFLHRSLRKDFKTFLAHAVKLSKAFQLDDNGNPKKDFGNSNEKKTQW